MSQRRGNYSSHSAKKKGGSRPVAENRASHQRSSASSSSSSSNPQHQKKYFPQNMEAVRNKGAATPHGGRSRAGSVSYEFSGDPFASVRLRSESNEPHMAQANIVLAAINDMLKEQGMDAAAEMVNPTHYFGVLMVLLEQRDTHNVETIGAILYLLSILLPQLPTAVLKNKSEPIAAILINVLEKNAEDAHVAKHVLECCSVVLSKAAVDAPPAIWLSSVGGQQKNLSKLLQVLLVYSLDHRPRIRRAGQEGVKEMLKALYEFSATEGGTVSGVPGQTAKRIGLPKGVNETMVAFCIREISQCTPKDCQVVLYLCGLLQSCIHFLSVSSAGKIMEALLSMVGKGNSILMVQTMRTIDAFFVQASEIHLESTPAPHSPEAKAREKFFSMGSQLLLVLLTLKPHQNDQLATAAYLTTLRIGLVQFTSALESMNTNAASSLTVLRNAYEKIPELLQLVSEGLLSPKLDVVKGSAKAMGEILKKTLTPRMIAHSLREAEQSAAMQSGSNVAPPYYRVIELMENLLGYRYKNEWNRILVLTADLFHSSIGSVQAQTLLVPLLKKLDALRFESMKEAFSEDPTLDYRSALDEALGAAIGALGPEAILTILPLNLPMDYYNPANAKKNQSVPLHEQLNASRSWLLPLFRTYVAHTSLAFFLDFFVPLANQLHQLDKHAISQSKLIESKAFSSLKLSVWDLFATWCACLPKDISVTFKNLARSLVEQYLNQDEMFFTHNAITKGLAILIRKLKELVDSTNAKAEDKKSKKKSKSGDEDEEDIFDEDESEGDNDDDDEDVAAVVARQRAKRLMKKENKAQQEAEKEAQKIKEDGVAASSSNSRHAANYTPAEAKELLAHSIAPLAKHLLPVLFNLAAMPREQKATIFEAIALLGSTADGSLLNSTFKKVLRKLLEHLTQMDEKRASGAASAKDENDDMDESSTNQKKSQQLSQDAERAHRLTDIVNALVAHAAAQLDAENVTYLHGIVRGQLESEYCDGALQKKLYKVLAALMQQHPTFFNDNWKQLLSELLTSSGTLKPAALKPRLTCLRVVLLHLPSLMLRHSEALGALPAFLGEVMLASKEVAAKTRDLAFQILIELGHKMVSVQNEKLANSGATSQELFGGLSQAAAAQPMLAEYTYMIAGGLAGTTAHMQSASAFCLARICYEFKADLSHDIIVALLNAVLPHFDSKSRELIKSLLAFIKVVILILPLEVLHANAPNIVDGLVKWCAEKKQRFKLKIKLLFEVLMKKLGVDEVRALVPDQHVALIEHIRKTKEREKRQKAEAWANRKGKKDDDGMDGISKKPLQDYDTIMKDDDDAEMDGGAKKPASAASRKPNAKDANAMYIRSGDVDFMDPSVVSKVTSSNPSADHLQRERKPIAYGHGVSQDTKTGKMVIAGDSAANALKAGQAAAQAMIDIDELESDLKAKKREKRKRDAEEEDEEENATTVKKQQLPGSQFRSTKAGGDMQRRGQPSPFAFVPLAPAALNKRKGKKFTAVRRMESIVNAAKTGSNSGSQIAKGKGRSHKNKSHKKHGH